MATPDFLKNQKEEVNEASLELLKEAVSLFKEREKKVKELEEELKIAKEKFRQISEERIPEILGESGLSEIKLDTGEKIIVKDDLKVNVSKANESKFFLFLKNRGEDDIIKLNYKFDKDLSPDLREELDDFLIESDIEFDSEMSVHAQTKKAYFKNLLGLGKKDFEKGRETGKYLPVEKLPEWVSVYIYKKTTIKE